MIRAFARLVIINLRRHKIRSVISIAGISFGVAAMLAVVSIVLGAIGMFQNILANESQYVVFEKDVSDLFFSSVTMEQIRDLDICIDTRAAHCNGTEVGGTLKDHVDTISPDQDELGMQQDIRIRRRCSRLLDGHLHPGLLEFSAERTLVEPGHPILNQQTEAIRSKSPKDLLDRM